MYFKQLNALKLFAFPLKNDSSLSAHEMEEQKQIQGKQIFSLLRECITFFCNPWQQGLIQGPLYHC